MKSMFAQKDCKKPNRVSGRCGLRPSRLAQFALLLVPVVAVAQSQPKLDGLPGSLTWRNSPKASHIRGRQGSFNFVRTEDRLVCRSFRRNDRQKRADPLVRSGG